MPPGGSRSPAMDVLRGGAILGILLINLQSFSSVQADFINPTASGRLTAGDVSLWLVVHVLIRQKLLSILALLFGASLWLHTTRSRGPADTDVQWNRLLWLLVLGLVHGYLIWQGDILYSLALCGLVVYRFRRGSSRRLLVMASACLCVPSVIFAVGLLSEPYWPSELRALATGLWDPPQARVDHEIATYRAGWVEQMAERAPATFFNQTAVFAAWRFWRLSAWMLFGIVLARVGIFGESPPRRMLVKMLVVGICMGLPLELLGLERAFAARWRFPETFFSLWQFNYWSSVGLAFGWSASAVLLCQARYIRVLQAGLSAVGRMALTNYLFQTACCAWIYHGHGLGLVGRTHAGQHLALFAGLTAVQVGFSVVWLRYFRQGPIEGLWRSLAGGARIHGFLY